MAKTNPFYEERYCCILQHLVLDAVEPYSCRVFLFGSRARGNPRWGSDYDIAIEGLDQEAFEAVKRAVLDAAEESIIPWPVDLVNLSHTDHTFRERILQESTLWKAE